MNRKVLILILAFGILFNTCVQKKTEQKEQIKQELVPIGMLKLYKNIENKLHYWETWDKDTKTGIVHWGEVGTKGQDKEIKSEPQNNYANKIRKEIKKKMNEGYTEFDEDKYASFGIKFKIGGFGTKQDLDKMDRLVSKMDEVLSQAGLGYADGVSVSRGAMEVICAIVDFDIAKKVVEESLKNTEFENYSTIF